MAGSIWKTVVANRHDAATPITNSGMAANISVTRARRCRNRGHGAARRRPPSRSPRDRDDAGAEHQEGRVDDAIADQRADRLSGRQRRARSPCRSPVSQSSTARRASGRGAAARAAPSGSGRRLPAEDRRAGSPAPASPRTRDRDHGEHEQPSREAPEDEPQIPRIGNQATRRPGRGAARPGRSARR